MPPRAKNPIVPIAAAMAAVLTTATLTLGHDTWLLPERLAAQPGSTITLYMTSGMVFPTLDYAIHAERVRVARCRLAGKTTELTKKIRGAKALQFQLPLPKAGVATVWVETGPPLTVNLSPDKVREYFAEIDAPSSVRKAWENQTARPKRWREQYSKHAKTFVRVGESANDVSWRRPVGMPLEIVLEQDPQTVPSGKSLTARVLKNGLPLKNFSLGMVREGEKSSLFRRTDAMGRAAFPMTKPGRYLLRGTELRRSNRPNLDWESDFTTLTFGYRL